MSHCRTPSFNDHLDHCFTIKLLDAQIGHLKEQNQCLPSHRFSFETCVITNQCPDGDRKAAHRHLLSSLRRGSCRDRSRYLGQVHIPSHSVAVKAEPVEASMTWI